MAMPWLFSAAFTGTMPVMGVAIIMVNRLKRDKFLCIANSDLFRFMNGVVLLFPGFLMPVVLGAEGEGCSEVFLEVYCGIMMNFNWAYCVCVFKPCLSYHGFRLFHS